MKSAGKLRLYRYYDPFSGINTQLSRQIQRYNLDPIRLYEGANEKVSINSIKAVLIK